MTGVSTFEYKLKVNKKKRNTQNFMIICITYLVELSQQDIGLKLSIELFQK